MSSLADLSTEYLEAFRPPSNITRDTSDSGITDSEFSRASSTNLPSSRQTSTSSINYDSFFDDYNEERPPLSTLVEGDEAETPKPKVEAQGSSAAAATAGPEESTKAQQNMDLTEMLVEVIQPFFVEILQCYKEGFKYISTTQFNTVLAESEKYHDPIIGNLVDRIVCAAIPTFYPTELPNFDPYLASALIKHVLPRLQDFIYDGKCDVEKEPEMTEQEMRDMIDNIMPLTPVKSPNFEQLCSNFLDVRREAVDQITKLSETEGYPTGLRKRNTPNYGGRRQTKKYKKMKSIQTKKNRKNNKVYRGGQRWRVWYMGFLILIFGIALLCTLFYTMYELNLIKKQVDVALQTQLVKKIIEIIKTIQKGEEPSQRFSAISYNVTNPKTDSKSLVTISESRSVVDFDDLQKYPLSLDSSEVATIDQKFIDELQDNKDLFLQLQQISEAGPLDLIYLYMSGGFAIDSFDLLNKLSMDAAKFLLTGIETFESAKIKRELVELQKGFESFSEINEGVVLSKFFSECYASEIGSGNIADAHSLLYVAENYGDYYKLVSKMRLQKLMPNPKVVKDFTNGLVRTLVEQNEKSHITDPVTGVQGDQTPVNPGRALIDKVPGAKWIADKIDSMTETVKNVAVTKELADEKAECFVRTMQSISSRKFAELEGLTAGLKLLKLNIGDLIGVEVVKNAFYFVLPKGARLLSCYNAITYLTGLLIGSIITYGIYKRSAAQGDEVAQLQDQLAEVQQRIANGAQANQEDQQRIIQLIQQLIAAGYRPPGAQPGAPPGAQPGAPHGDQYLLRIGNGIGNGNNSNSNSSNSNSSNSNPSGSGSGFKGNYETPTFGSLHYKLSSSSMFNASSALTSNASSAVAAPKPKGSQSPSAKKRWMAQKRDEEEEDKKNRGGRRTRRRSRQTKKRRRRIKRRQTRKLRRNTKRRRM